MAEETGNGTQGAREALLREQLRSELEITRQQLAELQGMPRDIGDQTSDINEPVIVPWELSPVREDQLRQRTLELENALERLRRGTYGVCEECGQPIDIERLQALPHTRLCINCAREREAR